MQGFPGDLLSVGELRKDQLVEGWSVHDGKWFPAKVASVDGEGDAASATLSYIGYASRWNETFSNTDKAIRVRLPKADREVENMPAQWKAKLHLRNKDGTWPIEKLIKKRRRNGRTEFLVRWKVCPLPSACLRARPDHAQPHSMRRLTPTPALSESMVLPCCVT